MQPQSHASKGVFTAEGMACCRLQAQRVQYLLDVLCWGAGKSTLLDILSLRKTSGKIAGEVRAPCIRAMQ